MGKVHWGEYIGGAWAQRACDPNGVSVWPEDYTRDPAKVTCRHPACVKAAREAREK